MEGEGFGAFEKVVAQSVADGEENLMVVVDSAARRCRMCAARTLLATISEFAHAPTAALALRFRRSRTTLLCPASAAHTSAVHPLSFAACARARTPLSKHAPMVRKGHPPLMVMPGVNVRAQ